MQLKVDLEPILALQAQAAAAAEQARLGDATPT